MVVSRDFGCVNLDGEMMKCEDCKHFEQVTQDSGVCSAKSDNWFDVFVPASDDSECDKFEPYDSWDSVSK